jgi:hypothetical protein
VTRRYPFARLLGRNPDFSRPDRLRTGIRVSGRRKEDEMNGRRDGARARAVVLAITLFLLARAALAEDDEKARVKEAGKRIRDLITDCRKALRSGEEPPVDALKQEFAPLAGGPEGQKALAKYAGHSEGYVALLAVQALDSAPAEWKPCVGRLLVRYADPRYLTEERRIVFVETVRVLGRSGYLGAVDPLLKVLGRTQDPKACQAAVEALGLLGDPRAVPVLHDRLNTGTSVNLRGPGVGSEQRRRGMNPNQQKGLGGQKNNVKIVAGQLIESIASDSQPVDEEAVVNEIYETISSLLGEEFTSWHAVDRFLREHRRELKKAEDLAKRRRREQEREISGLLG